MDDDHRQPDQAALRLVFEKLDRLDKKFDDMLKDAADFKADFRVHMEHDEALAVRIGIIERDTKDDRKIRNRAVIYGLAMLAAAGVFGANIEKLASKVTGW